MSSKLTSFKPTPFNLSEDELDDLKRGYEQHFRQALDSNDIAAATAWSDAMALLGEARQASFIRRSNARHAASFARCAADLKRRALSPA